MHRVGTPWFLWIFGNNVEDAIGPLRFVVFYLLCGVAFWADVGGFAAGVVPSFVFRDLAMLARHP